MQIYCLKNELSTPEVQSILSTILDNGGFFYSWIDPAEAAETVGLFLEYAPAETETKAPRPCLHIPALRPPDRLKEKQSSWEEMEFDGQTVPLLTGTVLHSPHSNCFNFDIFANVYYHLMRIEESVFSHPDQMDPEGRESILYAYGGVQLPVVDILTDHFAQWLEQKTEDLEIPLIKKAAWPAGQAFAVALTHDVDFVRAFHPLKKAFLKLKARAGFTPGLTVQDIENQDQRHWGFEQLLSFYSNKNWQATFFFIARYLEGRHFRYRINGRKIKTLLKKLTARQHEIALHPSRFAFEHPGRYVAEKRKLECVSGITLKGMRHHYLRALFPKIWDIAARLDLDYETTLSYSRRSGFRSGTTRPYFVNERKKQILVIPTNFFENTLPNEGAKAEVSIKEIKQIMNRVKRHGGLFTALWHTNHILQPANYVKIWQEFINLLEQEKPWIVTLSKHSRWIAQRRAICMQHLPDGKIQFIFPAEIEAFTLLLPKSAAPPKIEGADISFTVKDRLLYIQNKNRQKTFILTHGSP